MKVRGVHDVIWNSCLLFAERPTVKNDSVSHRMCFSCSRVIPRHMAWMCEFLGTYYITCECSWPLVQVNMQSLYLVVLAAVCDRAFLNQLLLLIKVEKSNCAYSFVLCRALTLNLTSLYFKCIVRQEEHWDSIKTHFLLCTKIKSSESKTDTSSWKSIETGLIIGIPFSQIGTENRTLKFSPILKVVYWFPCKVEELRSS